MLIDLGEAHLRATRVHAQNSAVGFEMIYGRTFQTQAATRGRAT